MLTEREKDVLVKARHICDEQIDKHGRHHGNGHGYVAGFWERAEEAIFDALNNAHHHGGDKLAGVAITEHH